MFSADSAPPKPLAENSGQPEKNHVRANGKSQLATTVLPLLTLTSQLVMCASLATLQNIKRGYADRQMPALAIIGAVYSCICMFLTFDESCQPDTLEKLTYMMVPVIMATRTSVNLFWILLDIATT